MSGWGRSLVAGINAGFRREERRLPEGRRIVDDPWAAALVDPHWMVRLIAGLRVLGTVRRAAAEQQVAHCVRHRAIDALVGEAIEAGARQVVILGAGYDMRAARLARPGLRFFEVDRRAILRRKAGVLGAAAAGATRVEGDLGDPDLLDRLSAAGWDRAAPTVFVLEGVLHYLPPELPPRLFQALAEGGPRWIILSFIDPEMVPRASGTFRWMLRLLREIPRLYVTAEALAALLASAGWEGFRHWDHAAQVARLAPVAAGRPAGLTQEVAMATAAGRGV